MRFYRRQFLHLATGAAALPAMSRTVWAQTYPARPVTIIVPFAAFVGGIEKNKHESKKLKAGRGTVGKTAVLGMRERGGRTVAVPIANTDKATIQDAQHR